jgi:hypothetical protein
MKIPEKVSQFLRNHSNSAFCDDCLKKELSLLRRQQAQRVTDALGQTSDFLRRKGQCSTCNADTKFVIQALGSY